MITLICVTALWLLALRLPATVRRGRDGYQGWAGK